MCLKSSYMILIVLQSMLILTTANLEILVLISSQNTHHYQRAQSKALQEQLLGQATTIPKDYVINVHIVHEIFNYPGDWTVLDALPHLIGETRLLNDNTKWIIWCQHNTNVSLERLLTRLKEEDNDELAYYGHALYDQEATIVHHFAFFKNPNWFPYPMLSAGIVFTGRLLKCLAQLVANNKIARNSEFSIDAAHELARFIYDNLIVQNQNQQRKTPYNGVQNMSAHSVGTLRLTRKIILKSAAYICARPPLLLSSSKPNNKEDCLMYALPEAIEAIVATDAGGAVAVDATTVMTPCLPTSSEHIYVAIKTCAKFHVERIPIIESTWAGYAVYRKYYSDVTDASIPTVNTGTQNVESGHCAKTLAILQLSLKDIEEQMQHKRAQIRWLLLVDDDTLLSISRLSALLAHYNHQTQIYLGERYGYRLYAHDGFNYITGGGGIIFSLPLVRRILQKCSCPAPTAPDDMILGYCLQSLGVQAIHSDRFHQARPQDYALELLSLMPPISFHKFWQLDPQTVYEIWFARDDQTMWHMTKQTTSKKNTQTFRNATPYFSFSSKRKKLATLNLVEPNVMPLAFMGLMGNKNEHLDL